MLLALLYNFISILSLQVSKTVLKFDDKCFRALCLLSILNINLTLLLKKLH